MICQGRTIGTITALPSTGAEGFILLAGRRWKVLSLDTDRGEILVEPARGGRVPYFAGGSGADLHPRVVAEMRQMLLSEKVPAFLDPLAKAMLQSARETPRQAQLDRVTFHREGDTTWWFTWAGSRVQRTLLGLGTFYAGLKVRDEEVAFSFSGARETEFRQAYSTLLEGMPAPEELARRFPVKAQEKYDGYLSEGLLAQALVRNCLDLEGAAVAITRAFLAT